MRKLALASAALMLAVLTAAHLTPKMASLDLGVTPVYAAGVDTGTQPAASDVRVLAAIIKDKDGKEIDRRYYAQKGVVLLFENADVCTGFTQLPFFPEIQAALDEYVKSNPDYPEGATASLSCEPPPAQ